MALPVSMVKLAMISQGSTNIGGKLLERLIGISGMQRVRSSSAQALPTL